MNRVWRSSLCVAVAVLSLAFACSTPKAGACDGVACSEGALCDPADGVCKTVVQAGPDAAIAGADAAAAGDAGPATCKPACSTAEVCDKKTLTCKTCTKAEGCLPPAGVCDTAAGGGKGRCVICIPTEGCPTSAPVCDTTVEGGTCRPCQEDQQCAPGQTCNVPTGECFVSDAGNNLADGGPVGSDSGQCVERDAGPAAGCTGECDRGYSCQNGVCVLNGGSGPVQVTLRWNAEVDLDLHVDEPTAAGACEIYWEDPNDVNATSSCGAKGSLDLDSNAGCDIDGVDIENVIYPAGQAAPSGTYKVRVDYYDNCGLNQAVPFEVTVRANGQTNGYCGQLLPGDADQGTANSGKPVTTFTVP